MIPDLGIFLSKSPVGVNVSGAGDSSRMNYDIQPLGAGISSSTNQNQKPEKAGEG